MPIAYCNAGSLSVTAEQARRRKPPEWWQALLQLLERDRKVKWVSALRLAHVFERLWLRIFSNPAWPPAGPAAETQAPRPLPACFANRSATCCTRHLECCCPTRRRAPIVDAAIG